MTIKEFRLAQGLSQPKLAQALGIGVSTIGGYESGRINPSKKVIDKIIEVYGVDLNAPVEAPAEKKPAKRAPKKKAAPVVFIQSAMGGEISTEEILAKVGDVDTVYIKPEDNAAYWVKGDLSGAINLW